MGCVSGNQRPPQDENKDNNRAGAEDRPEEKDRAGAGAGAEPQNEDNKGNNDTKAEPGSVSVIKHANRFTEE